MSIERDKTGLDIARLYRFSWALVIYTVLIIVWGAWVRISGSGDGCGEHWPLCHGAAIPLGASGKTWVEVSHRYSTAIFGILIIIQWIIIRRLLVRGHASRRWIVYTVLFTITEALIGRSLVKYGLVNESQSLYRLIVMPLHLVNTSLLLGAQVFTAESIRFGHLHYSLSDKISRRMIYALGFGLLLLLTSGAIAALGSHLMPSTSLLDGLHNDLEPNSHLAVRLRFLHPLLGLLLPFGFWLLVFQRTDATPAANRVARMRQQLGISCALAVLIGILTLGLLAPVWLKLCHLTAANLLIILTARYCYHLGREHN
jgi:cytochrome c oxidase assembly protein subunit 15